MLVREDVLTKLLAPAASCYISPITEDFPSETIGPNKLFQKTSVMAFYLSRQQKVMNIGPLGQRTERLFLAGKLRMEERRGRFGIETSSTKQGC